MKKIYIIAIVIIATVFFDNSLVVAASQLSEEELDNYMNRLVANAMSVSSRPSDTPESHNLYLSDVKGESCLVKGDNGLTFINCSSEYGIRLNFLEQEIGSNKYLIQLKGSPDKCLSVNKNNLLIEIEKCEKSPNWALFRLPEEGYTLHLENSNKCLEYGRNDGANAPVLRSCWGLSSQRQIPQIFGLLKFGNLQPDNNFIFSLGSPLLEDHGASPVRQKDPYKELVNLEKYVGDESISQDVVSIEAQRHIGRLIRGESQYPFKAVDSALVIANAFAMEGENRNAAMLAYSLEPVITRWADKNKIDDSKYRGTIQFSEYSKFAKILIKIYVNVNRPDLALPWEHLQLAKYQPTGVNSVPRMKTPIAISMQRIEQLLQKMELSRTFSDKEIETIIWTTLEMPLKDRASSSLRKKAIEGMPTSWNRNYGHKTDPYIRKMNPLLMGPMKGIYHTNSLYYARAHMYLGYLYSRLSHADPTYLEDSERLLKKAFEILYDDAGSPPYWMARLYLYLSYWAETAKRPKDLEKYTEIAEKYINKIGGAAASPLRLKLYSIRLSMYIKEGDKKGVSVILKYIDDEFEKNFDILQALEGSRSDQVSIYREIFQKSIDYRFELYKDSSSKEANEIVGDSFLVAQKMRLTDAANAILLTQSRLKKEKSNIDLIRQMQDAELLIEKIAKQYFDIPAGDVSKQQQRNLQDATNSYLKLREALFEKDPNYSLEKLKKLPLKELQNRLLGGQGAVLYRLEGGSAYLWALTNNKVRWWKLEVSPKRIIQDAKNLRQSILTGFDNKLSGRMYSDVFRSADEFFGQADVKVDTVFIEADRALQTLPFSLLEMEERSSGSKWLGEKYAFVTIPQIGMLSKRLDSREINATPKQVKYFGIADPANLKSKIDLSKMSSSIIVNDPFLRSVGSTDICNLSSLPNTKDEIESIAESLNAPGSRLLMGESATEKAVRGEDFNDFNIVHFATHAVLAKNSNYESGLVLTPNCPLSLDTKKDNDGLLTLSEIVDLKLDPNSSVILSACETAGGTRQGEEALSGLARAFFYAGANSLVVSHWPVDSEATRVLMVAYVKHWLIDGLPQSIALKLAMDDLRKSNKKWEAPRYWAPFVLISTGL